MEFYTYISDQNEKDGIQCHYILKCKYMNSLDVGAYTKWWNDKPKNLGSICHTVPVALTVPENLLLHSQCACAKVRSVILCTLLSDS